MAKVGLVWAVAVLGALFMTMASQGHHHDGGYSLSSTGAGAHQHFSVAADAPRPVGLALALLVLGGGATVLIIGATRGDRAVERSFAADPDPATEVPLARGLALLA